MFLLYLDAISVTSNRRSGAEASHGLHMEFSTKVCAISIIISPWFTSLPLILPLTAQDYYAIQEIQADSHVFKLIVGWVTSSCLAILCKCFSVSLFCLKGLFALRYLVMRW